jgi:hypothetical protein
VSSYHTDKPQYKNTISNFYDNFSPTPEEIEHVWEEGSKRPKTQNEKSRRKNSTQESFASNSDVFPTKNPAGNVYDIPIIVIKDDKNRRINSAKRNANSKLSQRPSTFKPGRSSLISSLDPEFLDLFQN